MPIAKKSPVAKKATESKSKKFTLEITLNGETTVIKTDDILAALKEFGQPEFIKTAVVFKVTSGDKSVEKVLNIPTIRRTLYNDTARILLADSLSKFING